MFGSTIDFSSEKTRRNSIIQQGKFMNIENKIREINDLITNHILRVVDGKEIVLIDLSGGHDTRVNLSVVLKYDIPFVARSYELTKGDLKISSSIAKKYNITRFVHSNGDEGAFHRLIDACDIRIHGGGYSEVMCVMLMRLINEVCYLL